MVDRRAMPLRKQLCFWLWYIVALPAQGGEPLVAGVFDEQSVATACANTGHRAPSLELRLYSIGLWSDHVVASQVA